MDRYLLVVLLAHSIKGNIPSDSSIWHEIFARNAKSISLGGTKQFAIKVSESECLYLCDNSNTLSNVCRYGIQCNAHPQGCNAFICSCWVKVTCRFDGQRDQTSIRPPTNQFEFQLDRFDGRQIQEIMTQHSGLTPVEFHFPSRSRYDLIRECQCDPSLVKHCPLSHMYCRKWSQCFRGGCVCNLTLGCFPLSLRELKPPLINQSETHRPRDPPPTFNEARFMDDLKTLLPSIHNQTTTSVYVTNMEVCKEICRTGSSVANDANEHLKQCDNGLKCHSVFENCAPSAGFCECKVSLTCLHSGNEEAQSTSSDTNLMTTLAGISPQPENDWDLDNLKLAALSCKSTKEQRDCRKQAVPKCQVEMERKCPSSPISQGGLCTFLYRGDFMEDNCCYKLECPRQTLGDSHEYSPDQIKTDTILADRVVQRQTPPHENKSLLSVNNGLHLSSESLSDHWNTFDSIDLGENRTISFETHQDECRHICGKAALRFKPICLFGTLCFAEFGAGSRGQFGNCSITLHCWGN